MKRHGIIVRPEGDLGAAFNPAAVHTDDGRIILLSRSVPKGYQKIGDINQFDGSYTSHVSQWESQSPDGGFSLKNEKALEPDSDFDRYGVEDPRVTKIGDTYYVFYTSIAKPLDAPDADTGIRIAMASTKDFKTYEKHGVIGPDRRSKAGILFESAGALYFMWKDEEKQERTMLTPVPKGMDVKDPAAWEAFWQTRDVEGDQLLTAQKNAHEGHGIEPGAPPIETDAGLLLVYSSISSDFKWTISLLLLDKDDPRKILAKTEAPFLKPEEDYELKGDVNNVVFPCGALVENDRLYVYYGAADTVCAVASESMDKVMQSLKPVARPESRPPQTPKSPF